MLFDFLQDLGNYESRCVGRWDGEHPHGELFVSTARVSDGKQPFETAIVHPEYNSGKHVIVEAYDTKEAAQEGHGRWQQLVEDDDLPETLVGCCNSEAEELARGAGNAGAYERERMC